MRNKIVFCFAHIPEECEPYLKEEDRYLTVNTNKGEVKIPVNLVRDKDPNIKPIIDYFEEIGKEHKE